MPGKAISKMKGLLLSIMMIAMLLAAASTLISAADATAAGKSKVEAPHFAPVPIGSELRTISFAVSPIDAAVSVQGGDGTEYAAEEGGKTFRLMRGTYMYTVRSQGYITKMGMLTIENDTTRTVTLEPVPQSTRRLSGMGQDHNNGANTGGPGRTKRDMEVESSGYVGWIRPTAWIKYANVDLLGGIQQYTVNYAIDGKGNVKLGFDIRIATPGSTFKEAVSIGALTLTQRTGGWGSPGKTATKTNLNTNLSGIHDVYIVFTQGEYNFGYLDLILKPETESAKNYDVSFRLKPSDATVVVKNLKDVAYKPMTADGRTFRLNEGFYRYTVSKPGYQTKAALLPADSPKGVQVVLLPEGANTYERYEAENGAVNGGKVVNSLQYSGGKAVGFQNISNVRFTVEGATTGIAEIIIRYTSSVTDGDQDRITIKSNDGIPKDVYLNKLGKSIAFVDLRAGRNEIVIGGNAWVNLDNIDVNQTLTPGSVEPGELDAPYIQPRNPIIKSIYTADPEAHVWPANPNKLYLYPSHDIDPPRGCDFMDVYHVYSTENMVDWVDEGEILRADDLPWGRDEGGFMWAPDAAYKDGYYYFYWPHPTGTDWGNTWETGVLRSRFPDRGFEQISAKGFKGYIEGAGGNGMIDVCVRVDDDGQAYIYIGGSQRFLQGKLKDDMITLDGPLTQVDPSNVPYYHEGPSVFKRNGLYYLIYPGGSNSAVAIGDKFNYCTSENPLGPWTYRGYFFNPTGCDTSHGSIVEFRGKWYMFYHTQDLSGNGTLRSVCVDEIEFNEDGTIQLFSKTTEGAEQNGPDYTGPKGKVYDANTAEIGGGAVKSNDPDASSKNGTIITDLHRADSYVQFNNVDGGKGGRASIVIHYSTPDRLPKMKLFVNGFDYSYINLPYTGGRSFFTGESSFTVKRLEPGATNTIMLMGGESKVNLDYIEVIPFDDSTTPAE